MLTVDVFISYGRLDRLRVEPVNEALQELGLSTFFDLTGIDGGDTFPDAIDKAVKSAGAVVACWTPYGLGRDWVKTECLIALERKTLVPIEIESVTAMDVPAAFFSLHRVNLADWRGEREHPGWLAAVRAIAKKLGRPDLSDRARAAAAVKGTVARTQQPAVMDALWKDWAQLAASSDRVAIAGLQQRAAGTVVEPLATARVADLDRPALARLTGGSIAIGLPPRRGWALVRFVALWSGLAAALIAGAARGYVYLETRARTEVAGAAERDRLAAENENLIRRLQEAADSRATGLVRTNAFLRGLTRDKLVAFFAPNADGIAFADGLLRRTDILARAGIDTPLRLSHFLAQLTYETQGFSRVLSENLNYSGKRLWQTFPTRFKDEAEAMGYDKQPERIANRIYANRMGNGDEASGDGWRYRGRGFIGLTGRRNYRELGQTIGVDLEANPDQLYDPEVSLAIAAVFWSSRNLNGVADSDDIRKMTMIFSGGLNGLSERQRLLDLAKKALEV